MRILVACSSRELFGADRSALRLAEVLRTLGHDVALGVPSHRPDFGLDGEALRRGLPVVECAMVIASSAGLERPRRGLRGTVGTRRRVDLLIVNSSAVLCVDVSAEHRITVVREWLEPDSPRHRVLAWAHAWRSDRVIAVSTGVAAQWASCVPGRAATTVVPNWLEGAPDPSSDPRGGFLFLGRFNAWKGAEVLADAWDLAFADVRPAPALTFVGAQDDGDFGRRSKLVSARAGDRGWYVHPFCPEPARHLASAAVLVVPSMKPEPFGTVMLEALAHGCRVLAFDGGGPADVAAVFPGAVTLVPRSTPALAEAMRELAGRPPLAGDELAEVRSGLETEYGTGAAERSWGTILASLGGSGRSATV